MNVHKQLIKRKESAMAWMDLRQWSPDVSLLGPTVIIDRCLLHHTKYDLSKETCVFEANHSRCLHEC